MFFFNRFSRLLTLVVTCVTTCLGFNIQSDSSDSGDIDQPSLWLGLLACVVILSMVALLLGCLQCDLCPRRHGFGDFNNEEQFFDNICISPPPPVDFPMYPPVVNSPEASVVFDPLPSVVARRRSRPVEEINVSRLRPKVAPVTSRDSDKNSQDEVPVDEKKELAMLEKLLTNNKKGSKQNIPRAHLNYHKEIGNGWFGKVIQSEIVGHSEKVKVVVLSLKEDATPLSQLTFLQESTAYRELSNAHTLKLLCHCTESIPFLTVYELCPLGDLKTYLRAHLVAAGSLDQQGLLLKFANHMASGLQALHENNFVHRDFAIRNCLIASDMSVKVGDYGLAEEKFKDDYFEYSGCNIPIRWLAPEVVNYDGTTISLRVITRDANVWSFGVALWELTMFGELPYPELSNGDVLDLVIIEQSCKLPHPTIPLNKLDNLFQLMNMCWEEATERPSLREICTLLSTLHSNDIDTSAFDEQWNQLASHHSKPENAVPTVFSDVEDAFSSVVNENFSFNNIAMAIQPATGHEASDFGFNYNGPLSFDSDNYSEMDPSLMAQAGSLQSSLKSSSQTSENPQMVNARDQIVTEAENNIIADDRMPDTGQLDLELYSKSASIFEDGKIYFEEKDELEEKIAQKSEEMFISEREDQSSQLLEALDTVNQSFALDTEIAYKPKGGVELDDRLADVFGLDVGGAQPYREEEEEENIPHIFNIAASNHCIETPQILNSSNGEIESSKLIDPSSDVVVSSFWVDDQSSHLPEPLSESNISDNDALLKGEMPAEHEEEKGPSSDVVVSPFWVDDPSSHLPEPLSESNISDNDALLKGEMSADHEDEKGIAIFSASDAKKSPEKVVQKNESDLKDVGSDFPMLEHPIDVVSEHPINVESEHPTDVVSEHPIDVVSEHPTDVLSDDLIAVESEHPIDVLPENPNNSLSE